MGGGCEADMTARVRHGCMKVKEYGEFLYGKRFPLKMDKMVYRIYAKLALCHDSETMSTNQIE